MQVPNNHQASFSAEAFCPDQGHDIPLGGDCQAGPGPGVYVAATGIDLVAANVSGGPRAGYGCRFEQPTTNSSPATIGVLCLRNAR
jgi:hypothetical protein